MSQKAKIFRNHVHNCRVFHPDGRQIQFLAGKHVTTLSKDIDYLQSLVDAGDQYVYIDAKEFEVDVEELTPEGRLNKIKKQAIEEYLAGQAAADKISINSGVQNTLGAASSSDAATGQVAANEKQTGIIAGKVSTSK
jgi:hypothetical protein